MPPAARVGDMHVCPMQTPGLPPIPHVGGPILPPGCPHVLIGNMPAAGMGDSAVCVGPPDGVMWRSGFRPVPEPAAPPVPEQIAPPVPQGAAPPPAWAIRRPTAGRSSWAVLQS